MTDLSSEINAAFTATQVLLVFVIFLFTIFYPEIQRVKYEDSNEESDIAKNNLAKKVRDAFWGKCFILISSISLVLCLFAPVCYQVAISLTKNFNYNYSIYSFILVFTFSLGFLIWSIKLSHELYKKIKDLKGSNFFGTLKYIIGIKFEFVNKLKNIKN